MALPRPNDGACLDVPRLAAIRLAIDAARRLRARTSPAIWVKRIRLMFSWALAVALGIACVGGLLIAAGAVRLGHTIIIAAACLLLLALTVYAIVEIADTLFARAVLARDAHRLYSIIQTSASQLWRELPDPDAWSHATHALDHVSKETQHWRIFIAGTLAVLLSLFFATRTESCGIDIVSPLELLYHAQAAATWQCNVRALFGLSLLGMIATLLPLQWKIATFTRATTLAQQAERIGKIS